MRIEINCGLCPAKEKLEIPTPAGWARADDLEEENALCPAHEVIGQFVSSQCPGCVGGWGDCPLWDTFAYSHKRTVTEQDFQQIERGICPRRVNGTIGFNVSSRGAKMENIDLSERATTQAGAALALAIREYVARYPARTV